MYNKKKKEIPDMTQEQKPAKTQTSVIGLGTEKIYYSDAYAKEFDAVVQSCASIPGTGTDENPLRYAVVLDRTAFFPEEGGQSPDCGFLTAKKLSSAPADTSADTPDAGTGNTLTARVLDVQIRDGIITHITDAPLESGTAVHGTLDFHHRFSNMQQHSAEHLFSGLVWSRLGLTNVGFHLSDTEVTMDYSGPISEADAAALELAVNQIIWQNIESRQEFPTPEELAAYSYRSKTAIEGQVRLIIFPDIDICACCAPHVARTGEIGVFRVLSVQSHRGGVRIHMLAGERAFRYLIQENATLNEAARSLSTSTDQVPGRIEKLRTDLSEAKHQLSEARLALLLKETEAIPASQQHVCLFTEDLEESVLREAVNQLMAKHAGVCGIFNGNNPGTNNSGYRYVIGSSSDTAKTQKADSVVLSMQNRMKEILQARGGGRPPMIQGQVQASEAEIRELFENM